MKNKLIRMIILKWYSSNIFPPFRSYLALSKHLSIMTKTSPPHQSPHTSSVKPLPLLKHTLSHYSILLHYPFYSIFIYNKNKKEFEKYSKNLSKKIYIFLTAYNMINSWRNSPILLPNSVNFKVVINDFIWDYAK